MTSFVSCKKPEGGPQPHYQDTQLGDADLTRGVVQTISINTYPFILNFHI